MLIYIRRYQSLFIIYLYTKYRIIFSMNKTKPICVLFLIFFVDFLSMQSSIRTMLKLMDQLGHCLNNSVNFQ